MKISFVVIVLNGMPTLPYAISPIIPFAHELIIIEGAVEQCLFAADKFGGSTDGTVEYIDELKSERDNVRVIRGMWPEKVYMQNEALKYVTGDYIWLVDSDEIYSTKSIQKMIKLLSGDEWTQVNMIPNNYWKRFDYCMWSSKFFEPEHHYRRIFKFKPGSLFLSHRPPKLKWPNSKKTTEEIKLFSGSRSREIGVFPFHYSYVFDDVVKQKVELYHRYGWGRSWGIDLLDWYQNCFRKWTPRTRTSLEKKYGVWAGDRYSKTFKVSSTDHPESSQEMIKELYSI